MLPYVVVKGVCFTLSDCLITVPCLVCDCIKIVIWPWENWLYCIRDRFAVFHVSITLKVMCLQINSYSCPWSFCHMEIVTPNWDDSWSWSFSSECTHMDNITFTETFKRMDHQYWENMGIWEKSKFSWTEALFNHAVYKNEPMGRQWSCMNLWWRSPLEPSRMGGAIWLYKQPFCQRILRLLRLKRRRAAT